MDASWASISRPNIHTLLKSHQNAASPTSKKDETSFRISWNSIAMKKNTMKIQKMNPQTYQFCSRPIQPGTNAGLDPALKYPRGRARCSSDIHSRELRSSISKSPPPRPRIRRNRNEWNLDPNPATANLSHRFQHSRSSIKKPKRWGTLFIRDNSCHHPPCVIVSIPVCDRWHVSVKV